MVAKNFKQLKENIKYYCFRNLERLFWFSLGLCWGLVYGTIIGYSIGISIP